jgi:hypothetical protein
MGGFLSCEKREKKWAKGDPLPPYVMHVVDYRWKTLCKIGKGVSRTVATTVSKKIEGELEVDLFFDFGLEIGGEREESKKIEKTFEGPGIFKQRV